MTRVGIISQARMTSTRLPGKVLIECRGRALLEYHLERLRSSGLPVLVATTTNATDDPIVTLCEEHETPVHRGPEDDVLARFAGCVARHALDVVVRVTSDCPLIDGAVIREGVDRFLEIGDPDAYLSNTLQRTFPRGFDFEIFSGEALLRAADAALEQAEREHVTPYLYRGASASHVLVNHAWATDKSTYRVTLDTDEDLDLIRALIEDHRADELDCAQIIKILDDHPELVALNQHVEQKKIDD